MSFFSSVHPGVNKRIASTKNSEIYFFISTILSASIPISEKRKTNNELYCAKRKANEIHQQPLIRRHLRPQRQPADRRHQKRSRPKTESVKNDCKNAYHYTLAKSAPIKHKRPEKVVYMRRTKQY